VLDDDGKGGRLEEMELGEKGESLVRDPFRLKEVYLFFQGLLSRLHNW
jgi:hypothetical protein